MDESLKTLLKKLLGKFKKKCDETYISQNNNANITDLTVTGEVYYKGKTLETVINETTNNTIDNALEGDY